eukprot:scaffold475_cov279-Pinguiococcus_pyrenoidosus.AAC.18
MNIPPFFLSFVLSSFLSSFLSPFLSPFLIPPLLLPSTTTSHSPCAHLMRPAPPRMRRRRYRSQRTTWPPGCYSASTATALPTPPRSPAAS